MTAPYRPRAALHAIALLAIALFALAGCGGQDATDTGREAAAEAEADAGAGDAVDDAASRAVAPTAPTAPAAPMPPELPALPGQAVPEPGTDAVILQQHGAPNIAAPDFDVRAFAGTYSSGTTRLDIGAEGQFALDESGLTLSGTWALQADGKTVLLDPDSKGETDRSLRIADDGGLRLGGITLQRQR